MRVCHLTKYVHARGGSDFSEPSLFYEREMKMKQYIPDITERFPEGYGGVDMTPAYFGEPVDWSRAYQREKEDYEACMPLFEAMGTNINYQGKAGCGQHCKLANQIMIAGTLSGVCEALTYAKAKGLDLQTVLNSVSTGAAGSKQLDTFGPKILAGDYAPGFFMKHFIKDMKLALTEANMSNISLDVLSQVLANYEMLQAEGYGDLGTQALIKYYEEEMEE